MFGLSAVALTLLAILVCLLLLFVSPYLSFRSRPSLWSVFVALLIVAVLWVLFGKQGIAAVTMLVK